MSGARAGRCAVMAAPSENAAATQTRSVRAMFSIQYPPSLERSAMSRPRAGAFVLCAVLAMCGSPAAAQPRSVYQQTQYKGQEIGKLTGDVYYARMDDYVSVFMVTSEGIILVEPIGTEFATWLKSELTQRFKVPVKYVIYSHYHWDH